jgi:hypothetical protein
MPVQPLWPRLLDSMRGMFRRVCCGRSRKRFDSYLRSSPKERSMSDHGVINTRRSADSAKRGIGLVMTAERF